MKWYGKPLQYGVIHVVGNFSAMLGLLSFVGVRVFVKHYSLISVVIWFVVCSHIKQVLNQAMSVCSTSWHVFCCRVFVQIKLLETWTLPYIKSMLLWGILSNQTMNCKSRWTKKAWNNNISSALKLQHMCFFLHIWICWLWLFMHEICSYKMKRIFLDMMKVHFVGWKLDFCRLCVTHTTPLKRNL